MTLKSVISKTRESILDLIFPPRCIGCGGEGRFLCASCVDSFAVLEPPFCRCCGVSVEDEGFCPRCSLFGMTIDGIRSPFLHQGLVREAVHRLKYHNLRVLAKPLAGLLADYLETSPLPGDILTPVPSHSSRIRSRGYNQAALLAYELSCICGVPLSDKGLIRLKNTSSQVKLGLSDRLSNVEGVFQCKTDAFSHKRVLLIDDVCTTGATLDACAVALKNAGAVSVYGVTVSRECLQISKG